MTMERRTFLQLVAGGTVASAIGLSTAARKQTLLTWDENAPLFPGLPLLVGLRDDVESACHVTVVTRHGKATHIAPACTLRPGEERHIELPYPYETLIPGEYQVDLVALSVDGRSQDRRTIGPLTISGLRFGA
jgi:hypothetical protein